MAAFCTRVALVISLLASGPAAAAAAAEIYKCTDAKGVVVFSETSCGRDARKLDLRGQVTSGTEAQAGDGAEPAPAQGDDAERGTGPEGDRDWAAFKCSTEKGMVFYRFAHCPKTIDVSRRRADGDVQTVVLDNWPVHERGTNLPTACQAIHGRSAASRWGREYDDTSLVVDARGSRDLCAEAKR